MQSNVRSGSSYAAPDPLTPQQQQLLHTYDAPPYVADSSAGSIPFIDFANRYVSSGASFSPQVLAGLSADQIAAALSDPTSLVAKNIDVAANATTTVLCQLTGGQPAQVCTSPAATAFQARL